MIKNVYRSSCKVLVLLLSDFNPYPADVENRVSS